MKPLLIFLLLFSASCKKFLDKKSDAKLVVPSTLTDLQALLDYYPRINNFGPSSGETSSDDYYLITNDWLSISPEGYKAMYRWENVFTVDNFPSDWSASYDVVYLTNTVLDNLKSIIQTPANTAEWNNLKGQALFLRSKSFWHIADIWTLGYDSITAPSTLGIPLRLDGDFNQPSLRSNLQQTYERIIEDLKEAIPLLPVTPLTSYRSSRPAAFGLLARVYLTMRKYREAGLYADSSLKLNNRLLDYNLLNPSAAFPVPEFNTEVIFKSQMRVAPLINSSRAKIDSTLYASYTSNDLRKTVFFKSNGGGSYGFKGSYEGSSSLFNGISTNEIYLIRAESSARIGSVSLALSDLNTLLLNRWKKGTFIPFTASSSTEALQKILLERRKELVMRGIRWSDLKRLNKEGAGIVLKRVLEGQTYTLLPNDLRYALPIPEEVVTRSGVVQNPR